MMANGAVETERLWGRGAFHGVKADLGDEGRIRVGFGKRVRGKYVFVRDEQVKTGLAPMAGGPFVVTMVTKPLVAANGELFGGEALNRKLRGWQGRRGRCFRGEGTGRG